MAMSLGSGEGDPQPMIDINTTPLIDVMLVLLVMLIITIPIQTHAVKLNMPVGNPPPPPTPPVVHTIEVDFDGTVLWDGDTIPNRDTLEAKFGPPRRSPSSPNSTCAPTSLSPTSTWRALWLVRSATGSPRSG